MPSKDAWDPPISNNFKKAKPSKITPLNKEIAPIQAFDPQNGANDIRKGAQGDFSNILAFARRKALKAPPEVKETSAPAPAKKATEQKQ